MTGKARVGMLTIALLALFLAGMRAQGTTAGQKPPDAKPTQATATDTQAKPADVKAAAQEELPADFKAFNDAGREKDLQKRVEAYEKFIADHPKSPLVSTARSQVQTTLLATLKTAQAKYLELIQRQIETAKGGTSASALSSTYSRLASGLLSAGVMLDQAEEYGRAALSAMDEQKYIQERKEAAERFAEAFAKRAAAPPAAAAPAKPPAAAAAPAAPGAAPAAAAPATPPAPSGGFTISMVDGVPFAKPAQPRPATPASTTSRPAPTAPTVPTDDELRTSFRAEKAGLQATLGQVLLKRGKTAEGEALLKEAYAARPASATMATIARVLAGSAKKAGDDKGQLEYLTTLALSGRITKEEQADFEAVYRKTHNGSIDGLEEMLDERYMRTAPKVEVKPSTRAVKSTDRAVLVEMFTGAG
jgi:hypothetical protein